MTAKPDRKSKKVRSTKTRLSAADSVPSERRPGFIPPGTAPGATIAPYLSVSDPNVAFDVYITEMQDELQRILAGEVNLTAAIISHAFNISSGMKVYTHCLPVPRDPSELDTCLDEARRMTKLMLDFIGQSLAVFEELISRAHHVMPEDLRAGYLQLLQLYEDNLRRLEDPQERDTILKVLRRRGSGG